MTVNCIPAPKQRETRLPGVLSLIGDLIICVLMGFFLTRLIILLWVIATQSSEKPKLDDA